MMKYDDWSWHSGGDFPEELEPEAGATHIAMFLVWALFNGLGSEEHLEANEDMLRKLEEGTMSPGKYFLSACDGKLTEEDLSDTGNDFAKNYYSVATPGDRTPSQYMIDYCDAFRQHGAPYAVKDTWENFQIISPLINSRFQAWHEKEA